MSLTATRQRRYTPQRSAELALSLYEGARPADPAWVLAERWLREGEWSLGLQVVGASHVAVIARGGAALTEALVARPVHSAAPAPLQVLAGFPNRRIVVDTGDWLYAQEVARERRTPEELARIEESLLFHDPERLAAAYPVGPGGRPGLTLLSWKASASRLCLETVHTYPDEGVVVTTAALCRARC